jgi:hypothetical protein
VDEANQSKIRYVLDSMFLGQERKY